MQDTNKRSGPQDKQSLGKIRLIDLIGLIYHSGTQDKKYGSMW